MKKLFFPLLLSALFSFPLFSQAPDINVSWGELMKSKDANFKYIIGSDGEYFYTFGFDIRGIVFGSTQHFDIMIKKYRKDNFKLVSSTLIEKFEYKGKEAINIGASLYKGDIHLYFKVYNSKLDSKYLILKTIDKNGKVGKVSEIASVKTDRRSDGNFTLVHSPDSTKLLVHVELPYERKENEKFNVLVFDRSHNLLWEKDIELPYTDKHFASGKKSVANNGDVFLLAFATPDKKKGEKKERKHSNQYHKLFRITSTEDLLEFDLGLEDKFVNSASIRTDFGDNNMAIAGFYSEEALSNIGGSFFITIGQDDLKVKTASVQAFTKEFLKNFMSDRKAEKGRELSEYVFRDFIRKSDGGAVIIAEQYYVRVTTRTDQQGNISYTYYYHYNDIIAINILANGDIEWSSHIPKLQVTSYGEDFLSYFLMVDGTDLNFIFNDHRDNLDKRAQGDDVKSLGNIKKSVSILATIDKDGKVSYNELFSNKDFSAIMAPQLCFYNKKEHVGIIYGVKKSKTRFGRLEFQ